MSINRAAIFYENQIDGATLTATSEASSDFAVTSIQNSQPSDKWRSTGRVLETITAEFEAEQFIPAVAILRHNLTASATIRIRISDNSDLSAPTYDNTFYAWPSIYGLDEQGLDEYGLDGVPLVENFDETEYKSVIVLDTVFTGTATAGASDSITLPANITRITGGDAEPMPREESFVVGATVEITSGTGVGQTNEILAYDSDTRVATMFEDWITPPDNTSEFELDLSQYETRTTNDGNYTGRYLGVTIADPVNENSYVEVGVIFAGDYVQPGIDIDLSNSIRFEDPSQRFISSGQSVWVNKKNKFRVGSFIWSYLTENEARVAMYGVAQTAGRSKPVLYIPYLENSLRTYTDAIYGLLDSPPVLEQIRKDFTNTSYSTGAMVIRELL